MVVGFPIKGEQKKIYVFLWHILPTFAMGVFELFLGENVWICLTQVGWNLLPFKS